MDELTVSEMGNYDGVCNHFLIDVLNSARTKDELC